MRVGLEIETRDEDVSRLHPGEVIHDDLHAALGCGLQVHRLDIAPLVAEVLEN